MALILPFRYPQYRDNPILDERTRANLTKRRPPLLAPHCCITFDGLASALTSRSIIAADETVVKPLTIEESEKACEALIKAVYGASFDFIVERVNARIQNHSSTSQQAAFGTSRRAVYSSQEHGPEIHALPLRKV
jgi:hypothetical protein